MANEPKDHLMVKTSFTHSHLQPEKIGDAFPKLRYTKLKILMIFFLRCIPHMHACREGRGNLMLRHSVSYPTANFQSGEAQRRALSCLFFMYTKYLLILP